MDRSVSESRLAENEIIFRRANEQVVEGIADVKALAEDTNQREFLGNIDAIVLHFRCECMNTECQRRIPMSVREYEIRHKNRLRFVVIAGHQDTRIETVVLRVREYVVVEKHVPLLGDLTGLTP
jgi:hypothetical protein